MITTVRVAPLKVGEKKSYIFYKAEFEKGERSKFCQYRYAVAGTGIHGYVQAYMSDELVDSLDVA